MALGGEEERTGEQIEEREGKEEKSGYGGDKKVVVNGFGGSGDGREGAG